MRRISLLILFTLMMAMAFCVVKPTIAQQANEAYTKKQFSQALELYGKIESQGIQNADLYYNMGNCYYRLQKLGYAILYYKKALRLDSSHSSARKNLQLSLTLTRDQQYQVQGGFIGNVIMRLMDFLTLNRVAILILLFLVLSVGALYYIWFSHMDGERHLPVFILIILLFFLFMFIAIGFVKYHQFAGHKAAVLVVPSEVGYSGPGSDFTRVFTIHEGMIYTIEKEEDAWSQIKLPNGLGGWIPASSSIRVNP
ncbi:MAG TPA: tetratricopeptide repeat protein [Candidatus Cloacimonadota bacterium]|nr:tetratricopeptide repeat protein [Candidatus Cloacimonadota bacterium]HPT71505.1 tetratricopeptide repeat protein [Candidatus Cloacimonadota bacterium]